MKKSPEKQPHTFYSKRIALLTVVGLATGCQSIGDLSGLKRQSGIQQTVAASAVNGPLQLETQPPQEPAVAQVVYDGDGDYPVLGDANVVRLELSGADSFGHEIGVEAGVVGLAPEDANGTSSGMSLADFESLAMGNNPTIQELVATTQKAAGFRTQVGLRANPTIGYQGSQLADRGTDQNSLFISQTIVTGNKLGLNRQVLNEAMRAQLHQLEAQKYRVATDVRIRFFRALAAQNRVQLIRDFQFVSNKGLEFAQIRKEAEEGSQLEVVQAKVLKNEIDLQLQQAEVRFQAAWRELVAFAGTPQMAPVALHGELPSEERSMDWGNVAVNILGSSPEFQAAQARVSQARANLCRQQVQPIPNLNVQLGSGYDNATDNGFINVQVGAPLPVFNKNQGNIAAARAEYARAIREVERIENAIKARLAAASGEFDSSLAAVNKYSSEILPNAKEGLGLAEAAYRAGETSYLQVLIAQRSYFATNLEYITAQSQLGQARARIDGYVLTGALDAVIDGSGDDSLRGLTFSQQ